MSKLIKEIMDAINAVSKNKTEPYDRQGKVKRIEGKIAWVKLEGSDRETPIQMTIACDVGDTVQARIGGGSAWLTGNLTAPPTDDKKANQAISMVTNIAETVQETVDEALEDVSSVEDVTVQYCLSDSSSTFTQYGDWSNTPPTYVAGKYYWTRSVIEDDEGNVTYGEPRYSQDTQLSVETDVAFKSNNNHFWYDSSGAYVTTANKSYTNGSAVRITASGILQQVNGSTVSSWTNSGISFLQGGSLVASFGNGGVNLYGNGYLGASITYSGMTVYSSGSQVASFGSSISLGSLTGRHWVFDGYYLTFFDSSSQLGRITTLSSGLVMEGNGNASVEVNGSAATIRGSSVTIEPSTSLTVQKDTTVNGKVYADDIYTNCALGEASSTVANCRIAGDNAPHRICYTKGGSSSRRFKHDIKPIEEDILDPHRLYDVDVVQFVYNDNHLSKEDCRYGIPLAGFVAEDLYEVYPIAVDVENGECNAWNEKFIIPPMLALIQEQNERITKLEEKLS